MSISLPSGKMLVVAADFIPPKDEARPVMWACQRLTILSRELEGLPICIKVNSLLRAFGYRLIGELQERRFSVFADLKLYDVASTLRNDALFLRCPYSPEILTVACATGPKAIRALKEILPNTTLLAVTVLTDLEEHDAQLIYGLPIEEAVLKLTTMARDNGADGIVCAPSEAEAMRATFGHAFKIATPNIRPVGLGVTNDEQNKLRANTPAGALRAGADMLVVGSPIIQADDHRAAVEQIIAEMVAA